MKHIYWFSNRFSRIVIIACALCIYMGLEIANALDMFSKPISSLSVVWLSFNFGLFSFASLIFLVVGSLVWLYARERHAIFSLFSFSLVMMIIFTSSGNLHDNPFFSNLGSVSAIIAVTLFSITLFYFPQNLLLASKAHVTRYKIFFYCYLFFVGIFTVICSLIQLNAFDMYAQLGSLVLLYYILCFCAIVVLTVSSYIKLKMQRKKQQVRIFAYGVIVSFLPLLVLTIIPSILNLPDYSVDGRYTSLALVIFPLALGYSVLRYQLLVLDTHIRRVVSFIVGVISLAILVYVEVVCVDLLSPENISLLEITCIGMSIAIFAPLIWWLSRVITDRVLFPESIRYNRWLQEPSLVNEEVLNVDDTARLITTAAVHTFEVPQVCLLVLDETAACYQLSPTFSDTELDIPRITFFTSLRRAIAPSSQNDTRWFDVRLPALQRLLESRRPMLLSEITLSREELPRGLDRVMNAHPPLGKDDYLLAPLRVQGQMIGILVFGERADNQPYAGPDFEIAQMLTGRFASLLENARLYERASKNAALLNSVHTLGTRSDTPFHKIEDVANTYVIAAAQATAAFAEIWLYDEQKDVLWCAAHGGSGPHLKLDERFSLTRVSDWRAYFFSSQEPGSWNSERIPSCLSDLSEPLAFSFVWLPLEKNQRRIGVMVLSYERPHRFIPSEMRVLELFASQGAATFEDVRVAVELRAAYERQKELDALKDQFMMIASHELRTPLTAVQGYIELLCEHREMLTPETQVDFLEKARVGCDELNLMVGNIMDASLVHVDVGKMHMYPILLNSTILHVLDILDASIQREKRSIVTTVDSKLFVLVDDMRLRQILLNLLSNALKYSAPGTDIEIGAFEDETEIRISVRDYGLGVPPGRHQRLFERFMRLERDLNSPMRGAGLGLYICNQLVTAMGGRIWIESSGIPGEGSVFTFTLPRVPVDQIQPVKAMELPA
jgi:signal transduction histidine kinase